jgi:hypothetical protein
MFTKTETKNHPIKTKPIKKAQILSPPNLKIPHNNI